VGRSRIYFLLLFYTAGLANAQMPPTSDPDVILLDDGEKVIGHLERATSSTVTFKSDGLGELSIEWSKVKELHSSRKFAIIPKNVQLKSREDASKVPVGTPTVQDQKLALSDRRGQLHRKLCR
jgi:hypothetical protein